MRASPPPPKTGQKKIQAVLEEGIAAGRERGVQVAIYRNGRLAAEAWAGVANPFTGEKVEADTLFPVFSVSKGITATVIHRLVDRGILSYDMALAELWPRFGRAGKRKVTLAQALRHTAGLPELPSGLTFEEMLDWSAACAALAETRPKTAPGKHFAYHAKTYGWLVGEVARRATGRSFPDLIRDEVTHPLGLETLVFGLTAPGSRRLAFLEESHLGPLPVPPFAELATREAAGVLMPHQMNTPEMQAACLPSTSGLMNARAIARHYAALLPGGVDGVALLPPARLAAATVWETRPDPAGEPATWGLGYTRVTMAGQAAEGFGHGGYGGSMGAAFPALGLAIGYTRNRLGPDSGWEDLLRAFLEKTEPSSRKAETQTPRSALTSATAAAKPASASAT